VAEFQRGEIVRFVVEGPVLASEGRSMCIKTPEGRTLVLSGDDLNRIERVSPVGWPPRKNDVWRDGSGELLLGAVWAAEGPVLRSVDGSEYDTARALARLAPLTLVIRDGQPFPAPAEQDDAPVEEIAITMAAAGNNWSSHPYPTWGDLGESRRDQCREIARALVARYRIAPRQQEDVDLLDDPRSWTDPVGGVWDLHVRYADRNGRTWHWAGGFEAVGEGPMEPLWSRDNWSIKDVPHSRALAEFGPFHMVDREQQDGGESRG
jgi:hypothetical protein